MPQRGQQIEMQTISVNSMLTILMLKIVRTVISALTDFTGMKVLLFPGFEKHSRKNPPLTVWIPLDRLLNLGGYSGGRREPEDPGQRLLCIG